jgi:hypothetical protein
MQITKFLILLATWVLPKYEDVIDEDDEEEEWVDVTETETTKN